MVTYLDTSQTFLIPRSDIYFSSSFCGWQQAKLLDFHPVSKREKPRPPVALARQNMWEHRLSFNNCLLLYIRHYSTLTNARVKCHYSTPANVV